MKFVYGRNDIRYVKCKMDESEAGRTPSLSNRESARESAREHGWGTPSVFSRGGSLLPSIYADACCIDAVVVSKAADSGKLLLALLQPIAEANGAESLNDSMTSKTKCLQCGDVFTFEQDRFQGQDRASGNQQRPLPHA